jgi:hypothetical protein
MVEALYDTPKPPMSQKAERLTFRWRSDLPQQRERGKITATVRSSLIAKMGSPV